MIGLLAGCLVFFKLGVMSLGGAGMSALLADCAVLFGSVLCWAR
jgi:hypothetical protein